MTTSFRKLSAWILGSLLQIWNSMVLWHWERCWLDPFEWRCFSDERYLKDHLSYGLLKVSGAQIWGGPQTSESQFSSLSTLPCAEFFCFLKPLFLAEVSILAVRHKGHPGIFMVWQNPAKNPSGFGSLYHHLLIPNTEKSNQQLCVQDLRLPRFFSFFKNITSVDGPIG